jgi:hypothetical protein
VSSLLATATRQGAACAYVDVADAFDPFSAAAIGIDLRRLLWVRAGRAEKSDRQAWTSLDLALRATDLLLNAGGFRVIVLDMGDVRAEQVLRVPLASWYRYRLQAENSQALFLFLAQTPCANSCASVVLHCKGADEQWEYATVNQNGLPLLTGLQYSVSAGRKRGQRTRVRKSVWQEAGVSCSDCLEANDLVGEMSHAIAGVSVPACARFCHAGAGAP